MIQKQGRYIRAWAGKYNGRILLEISDITDPGFENSITLITREEEFEKEAEALIEEFSRIIREIIKEVSKTTSRERSQHVEKQ